MSARTTYELKLLAANGALVALLALYSSILWTQIDWFFSFNDISLPRALESGIATVCLTQNNSCDTLASTVGIAASLLAFGAIAIFATASALAVRAKLLHLVHHSQKAFDTEDIVYDLFVISCACAVLFAITIVGSIALAQREYFSTALWYKVDNGATSPLVPIPISPDSVS